MERKINLKMNVIAKGLSSNFSHVSVTIADCPDLREEPFHLACPGLGGSTKLVEIGGMANIFPKPKNDRTYDLRELADTIGSDPCFIIGAGGGPVAYMGSNSEMIANMSLSRETECNLTCAVSVDESSNSVIVKKFPASETRCMLLANLFFSEGKRGKVIKVVAKKRTGTHNFIASMRVALQNKYKDKPVGLGGVFLLDKGKACHHVIPPQFSAMPLGSADEINSWLYLFNMSAPLVVVGTFISSDIPGLDLRDQHFHSFSNHGEAGHYRFDTTPDTVEYIGYFALGETVYRVDQPTETFEYDSNCKAFSLNSNF